MGLLFSDIQFAIRKPLYNTPFIILEWVAVSSLALPEERIQRA